MPFRTKTEVAGVAVGCFNIFVDGSIVVILGEELHGSKIGIFRIEADDAALPYDESQAAQAFQGADESVFIG